MSNLTPPPASALPTARALVRSTLVALAVAAVLLVTAVLPAEYGIDPTGAGRVLGLTRMGEIKVALAREAEAENDAAVAAVTAASAAGQTEGPASTADSAATGSTAAPGVQAGPRITTVTLQPDEGKEVKLVMRAGARAEYDWSTDGGVVNFDTHGDGPGDPARGVAPVDYHGYGKGSDVASDEGVLVAAFDGAHGWFWRNRTTEPVTITLRTEGDYQDLRLPE